MRWLAVTLLLCSACFETYDAPPEVASINLEQGLYDPQSGPLRLNFTEPVDLKTLRVTLFLGRTNAEQDLCEPDQAGALPDGCTDEARAVVGPCATTLDKADPDSRDELRFLCDGGIVTVGPDNSSLSIEPAINLTPFERYILRIDTGLTDAGGRARSVPLDVIFQVKSNLPCEPIDFESGWFFTIFDIQEPISAQFHFVFWIQVNDQTGQIRAYGSDIDPNDATVDPDTNRDFTQWYIDPFPPTGATIVAEGQVAEIDGAVVLVVFPFTLSVIQPRVEAPGAELNGRATERAVTGTNDPPGTTRQVIDGRLNGPAVFLGDGEGQMFLGAGAGGATFIRLNIAEAPDLRSILPKGVTVQDVVAPFSACQ